MIFWLFSMYVLSFRAETITSLVNLVRVWSIAPWRRPTRIPETTTRLRKVSTITKIMSPVVHGDARRRERSARYKPIRMLRGIITNLKALQRHLRKDRKEFQHPREKKLRPW